MSQIAEETLLISARKERRDENYDSKVGRIALRAQALGYDRNFRRYACQTWYLGLLHPPAIGGSLGKVATCWLRMEATGGVGMTRLKRYSTLSCGLQGSYSLFETSRYKSYYNVWTFVEFARSRLRES